MSFEVSTVIWKGAGSGLIISLQIIMQSFPYTSSPPQDMDLHVHTIVTAGTFPSASDLFPRTAASCSHSPADRLFGL